MSFQTSSVAFRAPKKFPVAVMVIACQECISTWSLSNISGVFSFLSIQVVCSSGKEM